MNAEQLIRLECLKLAAITPGAERGGRTPVQLAGEYENFVRGSDKAADAAVPASAPKEKPQDKGLSRRN